MRFLLILILLVSCSQDRFEIKPDRNADMKMFFNSLGGVGGEVPTFPENGVRVFLITGQSNAKGRALNSSASAGELDPSTTTKIWNPTASAFQNLDIGTNNLADAGDHGVELGLDVNFQTYFPGETLYLIKYAVGSTPIRDHIKTERGNVVDVFWPYVVNGINQLITDGKIPYVYLIFSQGERDANPATDADGDTPAAHYTRFGVWIDQWRSDIGANIPVVAYETLDFYSGSLTVNSNMNAYESLRTKFECIPMVGETDIGDGLHFDYQAQKDASVRCLTFFSNYDGHPVTSSLSL
jgi:hypothetical protein